MARAPAWVAAVRAAAWRAAAARASSSSVVARVALLRLRTCKGAQSVRREYVAGDVAGWRGGGAPAAAPIQQRGLAIVRRMFASPHRGRGASLSSRHGKGAATCTSCTASSSSAACSTCRRPGVQQLCRAEATRASPCSARSRRPAAAERRQPCPCFCAPSNSSILLAPATRARASGMHLSIRAQSAGSGDCGTCGLGEDGWDGAAGAWHEVGCVVGLWAGWWWAGWWEVILIAQGSSEMSKGSTCTSPAWTAPLRSDSRSKSATAV